MLSQIGALTAPLTPFAGMLSHIEARFETRDRSARLERSLTFYAFTLLVFYVAVAGPPLLRLNNTTEVLNFGSNPSPDLLSS